MWLREEGQYALMLLQASVLMEKDGLQLEL